MQASIGIYSSLNNAIDDDAFNFITTVGITDSTQRSALDTLVKAAKSNGWWNFCKAIYPFIGGTATTHKYNLKNPQDTDAAFRLVFAGGITHSSTGVLPNGVDGDADTFFVMKDNLSNPTTSNHLSEYVRTDVNSGGNVNDMGSNWQGNGWRLEACSADITQYTANGVQIFNSDGTIRHGMRLGSRISSSDIKLYRNDRRICFT